MMPRMSLLLVLDSMPFWVFIPFLISVAAVWHWRGIWRVTAIIPLLVLGYALAGDIYSASQGGNLTGVLTYVASFPAGLMLLLLWAGRTFALAVNRRTTEKANPSNDESPDE